jgi:hypothetical protein
MGTLATIAMLAIVIVGAVRQLRENRRRGIKFEWSKALVTGGGCILITGLGLACLFAGFALDQPLVGVGLTFVILIGGLIGLIVWINRRWPTPST